MKNGMKSTREIKSQEEKILKLQQDNQYLNNT